MYRFIAALFFSVTVLVYNAAAQSLQSRANEIRAAMDGRDFARAETLVKELRASDPAAFASNNYDYLLARLAERRGAAAEATALHLGLLKRNSVLSQYSLWHLASLARLSGDLPLERQYLTRLLAQFPSSALTRRARDRVIDSLFETEDYRAAIPLLRPLASASNAAGRSAMARLGQAYARIGDAGFARSLLNQLIGASRDDYALQAATVLDRLDRSSDAQPSEFEALRRARIYLSNRHWREARAHMMHVAERFPASANRAEALYQIGFTHYREDNYEEAIKYFERAHSEFPEDKEGEQGYYYVGTTLQKARRYDEAARRYIDFITTYPDSDLLEGAYRNVVDSLRYAGNIEGAVEWSRRMGQRFAGKPLEAVALFNEAKIEMVRGRMDAAERLLLRLQAYPVYPRLVSAPIRGEAAFLRIYTVEQMGRLSEAARAYLSIPDDRDNFFGHRATMRLQGMARTPEGRRIIEPLFRSYREQARAALAAARYSEAKNAATQALRLIEDGPARRDLIEVLRASYTRLPAYNSVWNYRLIPVARGVRAPNEPSADSSNRALAAELIFLGLYDEGAPELRLGGITPSRVSGGADGDEESYEDGPRAVNVSTFAQGGSTAYSMAVYSNRGDHSQYAIAFAEPVFRSVPQDFRLELLPRDLAELLYPAPYKDSFSRYAPPLEVDPRLVLALARQESRFNPSVKSPAAARGLLQFISETALKLAREEGLEKFELDDVYDPQVAIRLAVRNVAGLFKLFPGNHYAVIASYNTYDTNVERWILRAGTNDVDRLMAEIAIPETKDYVAKVINNYRAYQQLYTRELRPRR